MVGDGSYMMLHSELQTAVQEGINVTVLLFDNASFGCINNLQMGHGWGASVRKTVIEIQIQAGLTGRW